MRVEVTPSPNANARRAPLSMLVLHYTGMESFEAAHRRLRDPDAQVSAHYLVREDGVVFQLVSERERAWHAGRGRWRGLDDINSRSVGVEIVNGGHNVPLPDGTLPPYPDAQIAAVISLVKAVRARHSGIGLRDVIGHSDLAPGRKEDPGEHFPWERLEAKGCALSVSRALPAGDSLRGKGLERGAYGEAVARYQSALRACGYYLGQEEHFGGETEDATAAFQRRWRQSAVTGAADLATLVLAERVAAAVQGEEAEAGSGSGSGADPA